MENAYDILKIQKDSTQEEIKKAYITQAKIWHPDKNPNDNTKEQFQLLEEAYSNINTKEAKAKYDAKLINQKINPHSNFDEVFRRYTQQKQYTNLIYLCPIIDDAKKVVYHYGRRKTLERKIDELNIGAKHNLYVKYQVNEIVQGHLEYFLSYIKNIAQNYTSSREVEEKLDHCQKFSRKYDFKINKKKEIIAKKMVISALKETTKYNKKFANKDELDKMITDSKRWAIKYIADSNLATNPYFLNMIIKIKKIKIEQLNNIYKEAIVKTTNNKVKRAIKYLNEEGPKYNICVEKFVNDINDKRPKQILTFFTDFFLGSFKKS